MSGSPRRQMAVPLGQPPRRPDRRPLLLAGAGAAALVLVVIFVVLNVHTDPPFGTPTPRPTGTSSASAPASATQSAQVSATLAPTNSSLTSSAAPPTASGETASPGPTGLVKAPLREVVFTSLGIDNPVAPEASERQLTFNVDGKANIEAQVSDITAGLVKMCLWPGDGSSFPEATDCVTTPDSSLTRKPTEPGPWTISLAGAQAGRSPAITLVVRFPSTAPAMMLKNIRFQGQDSPNYTGFDMKVTTLEDGELAVTASWDNGLGANYPYTMSLLDLSVEFEEPISVEGVSHLAAVQRDALADHTYQVTITNLQEEIIEAVFLRATVTWP